MVKLYSDSKLWLFERCAEFYKVKYIDKTLPEIPKTIEAFLGDIVHQSLEWLYERIMEGGEVELDELIRDFANRWKENFSYDLRINNGDAEYYFNKGIKFLAGYYQKNKPFIENTIDVERKILFPLDEEGEYLIQGYVDRIVLNENGEYEVHDYKTSDFIKSQEEVNADRQLGFYHLGLQEIFGKEKKVKLIWHFLANNKTIFSERTQEQLEKLKKDTLALIKKIESTTFWPVCGRKSCDWCEYKKMNGLSRWVR